MTPVSAGKIQPATAILTLNRTINTVKKIKTTDANGKVSVTTKEVIYQLVAFLYLATVEGSEPQEERFPRYEQADIHAASQNDPE